jgi:hypothetical protein
MDNNWKIMQGRVIILVHCTSSQYGLSTYAVSSWYLKYFLRYAPDKNVGRKDGRTEGPIVPLTTLLLSRESGRTEEQTETISFSNKPHFLSPNEIVDRNTTLITGSLYVIIGVV